MMRGVSRQSTGWVMGAIIVCVLLAILASRARAQERIFVHMLPTQPASLDPAKSSQIDDDMVRALLYDSLMQLSADGTQLNPALAERWQVSADGLTYTFTLRQRVRFHDGTILDAETVKASYERQFVRDNPFYSTTPPNAFEGVLSRLLQNIRVIDPQTVSITMNYTRPSQLAITPIVSRAALEKHNGDLSRNPIGTGRFRLDRWSENEILLSAFPDSWRGRARLDRVRFPLRKGVAEMLSGLSSGENHLVTHVPPDYLEQLGSNPNVGLMKYGGLNVVYIGMRQDRADLKDRRVREAIIRAVDRERLATVLGRGAMIPARGPLPPGCGGYEPSTSQPSYNPDRARELLKEAGIGRLTLRLLYSSPSEIWSEIAHAFQNDLGKIGVDVTLDRASDWNQFHTARKKLAHDLYLYNWAISTPDPERLLFPLFHSQSSDNFSAIADARIDRLLDDARKVMTEDRRLQIYAQVNRLVVDNALGLFLVHRIGIAAVNNHVRGLTLNLYGRPHDQLATVEIR
jgi:peptide/nickel transport system substrate-binding protein